MTTTNAYSIITLESTGGDMKTINNLKSHASCCMHYEYERIGWSSIDFVMLLLVGHKICQLLTTGKEY